MKGRKKYADNEDCPQVVNLFHGEAVKDISKINILIENSYIG